MTLRAAIALVTSSCAMPLTEIGGKWVNIQLARSADLVSWQHLGDALPAKPRPVTR